MKNGEKVDFVTLTSIGIYSIILLVSGYLLQSVENGIGIFVLIALAGLIILVFMHSKRAIYVCAECNQEFKISPIIDLLSPHKMDAKYLKCPICKKRQWCKEKR